MLRFGEHGEWQVQLAGPGEHRIEVDFRASVKTDPARKWLSVPIPEAASTSLGLDFLAHESDIVVGSSEDFGMSEPGGGRPRRLVAHLSPRSKLEVSWAGNEGLAEERSPLLSAQGEIAIDIDADQMRTRSSWMIRCVRGMTRELEIRLSDEDEPTELLVDEQSIEGGIERKAGKVTVHLSDVLRPGKAKRVVMKTRRSFSQRGRFARFVFRVSGDRRPRTDGIHRGDPEPESVGQPSRFPWGAADRPAGTPDRPPRAAVNKSGV